MKKKIVSVMFFTLLLIGIMLSSINTPIHATLSRKNSSLAFDYADALLSPDLPSRSFQTLTNGQSRSPGYYETSEYLIGSVAVGIVFLESNGTIDPSTEDWISTRESLVVSEICDGGLSWLSNYNLDADVSFVYDIHYRVPTSYEPISHPSFDEGLWISEAMAYLGYSGISYFTQVRDYVNDLRDTLGTDWAFTIFVVNSKHDNDGKFTDGRYAYAWLGGPFLVMTYDNGGYSIENMDYVVAHETCHIFYATDEYNGMTETSGYLGVQDNESSGCMMELANTWWLCQASQEQLGWRDSDGDGILDIVDTFPNTVLNEYLPDPTTDRILTYTGDVIVNPYPNNNPHGSGRDVTTNTIAEVEFRVDGGVSQNAMSEDGAFDEAEEHFFFTTQSLSVGTHTIITRGQNSVGNAETSYANDTVTVAGIIIVPDDYEKIQWALGNASDGDTIYIRTGVYNENITIGIDKTLGNITLMGESRANTIINGSITFMGQGEYNTIRDLQIMGSVTIRGEYGEEYDTIMNNIIRSGVILESGLFSNIQSNSISGGIILTYWDFQSNNMEINIGDNILSGSGIDICQGASYVTATDNRIFDATVGIHVRYQSLDSIISGNTFTNNNYGIYLEQAWGSKIFHNNFINNTVQAEIINSSNIFWDDDYPSGGNYWSDYVGIDDNNGPNQDQFGSDGIGDTSYNINANNRDNYPLMKPYGVPHDIGLTNIVTSKTVVGQGYGLNITIRIVNYGINTETFNVTVYANTTIIQNFINMVLTSRNFTTVTFKWNTTGFAYGRYVISAVADTVLGETDTTDNTHVNGVVLVTIAGDINGDGNVDMYDFGIFAQVYASSKGDQRYNPNADLDCSGRIDYYDFGIFAQNYGKTVY